VGWGEVHGGGEASSIFSSVATSRAVRRPDGRLLACLRGGRGEAGREGERMLLCISHDGGGRGEGKQKNAQ